MMNQASRFKSVLVFSAFLPVLFAGCSGETKTDRPQVFPVSGKVTFKGAPPKDAVIKLYKAENDKVAKEQILPHPKARVKDDGTFAIGTYGAGDGAPEGEYIMTITWRGEEFDNDDDNEKKDFPELLPKEYTQPAQSKLRVTVKKDEENVIPEITIDS